MHQFKIFPGKDPGTPPLALSPFLEGRFLILKHPGSARFVEGNIAWSGGKTFQVANPHSTAFYDRL